MSIRTNVCQIRGEDSRSLLYWKTNFPRDLCGRGATDKDPNDYQTRSCMAYSKARNWESSSESRKKGKNEKPKLDNARRLRGIYFLDPDDLDYKETLQNARRKLDRHVTAAMPCKRKPRTSNTKVAAEDIASQKGFKNICGWVVESHESTRQRVESSLLTKHEDHIAGKGKTSMTITIWFTSLFVCHKRWKFRTQKQQWTKNGRSSK